jgi:hypothetical protein
MQYVTFEIKGHPINARGGGRMEGSRSAISRKWLISSISECGIRSSECGMSLKVWAAWDEERHGQAKVAFRASGDDLA